MRALLVSPPLSKRLLRCEPGSTYRQPFGRVASSSAIHSMIERCEKNGSTGLSVCQVVGFAHAFLISA